MKIKTLFTTVLLGTAALLLVGHSARAALTYSAGDLFLGFRSPTASQNNRDYLVNIGNVSQFTSLSPGSTRTVTTGGSIKASLDSEFTTSWFGSGSVFWSISGTPYDGINNVTPTIFATRNRSNPAIQSQPWIGRAEIGQTASVGKIQALKNKYVNDGVAAGTPTATFQLQSASNSYASFTDNTLSGSGSDFDLGGSIEGLAGSSTVLDFYRVDPVAGKAAAYLGYFTIADTGTVTFTAVPEPSTVVLLGMSALAGVIVLRRRSKAKPLQS